MQSALPGPLRFARMAGSSIAAPGAAFWVTDFLNAAYYARGGDRDVDDLRLAHGIITTLWAQHPGRRLGGADVVALHRAFGKLRFRGRGRLDRAALLAGGEALLGDWFADSWSDHVRRGWGIAFRGASERADFDPGRRLRRAALGPLTPPRLPAEDRIWTTYDPVELPDPGAAIGLLTETSRWSDIGCASGRFTALRRGGLLGQTFEIEVVADPVPRSPIFTRGYVTCTEMALADPDAEGPTEVEDAVAALAARYRSGMGEHAPPILPAGAEPLLLAVLTTHEGHFLGRALSHLLVWRDRAGTWIRDVGSWDPLPAHLAATYRAAGRAAQEDFWGPGAPERSMLAQLALVSSR